MLYRFGNVLIDMEKVVLAADRHVYFSDGSHHVISQEAFDELVMTFPRRRKAPEPETRNPKPATEEAKPQ